MKIVWSWLSELCDIDETPARVAERMTLGGFEVEGITQLGDDFPGVVVAEVVSSRRHPRADKLTLVTVTDGIATHEVVCGAPNVPAPGHRVLWARPGSRLPGGREIAAREIQGISSPGMLCSEAELGIGSDGDGIIVLAPGEGTLGADAADALALRDTVLDVSVFANRGDCLGHLGIAREVAALYRTKVRLPDVTTPASDDESAASIASVVIDDPAGCPRYTARVISGVRVGPSPRWMRRRLEAVGMRPLSNIVDVTNYVMFELGQPLHAFDLERVAEGRILVRRARAGERMRTLDGQDRELVPDDLLICDARGPVALAGVMGGLESEVEAGTTRVLLEAAAFHPTTVRRTSKRLGLTSESSIRFERGVDDAGAAFASARAAKLMAELAGGRVHAGVVDVAPRPSRPVVIELRPQRVRDILGVPLETGAIAADLGVLGLGVEEQQDLLVVTCPTWRKDLEREIDLVEEVGRVHGYEAIPPTLPMSQAAPERGPDELPERVRDLCAAAGLAEAITFAFTSAARLAALRFPEGHVAARAIAVANPMRDEQALMRTSLLPNLLAALQRNLAYGETDVRLFEVGSVFLPSGRVLPDEPLFVAGVLCGERAGWLKTDGPLDFYDAKGVVERVFAGLGRRVEFVPARSEDGFLHSGLAAAVRIGELHLGVVGEVHPVTRDRLSIDRPCFAFELNLSRLPAAEPTAFRPVGRFPAVTRDISFFVDELLPAGRVADVVEANSPKNLVRFRILEDYREKGRVPPGKKGMLWSFTYQADDRTLTDAEVDAAHETLVAKLLGDLRAERR
jgi:phenylalanyl-tRNA synthetase beta chain